KRYPLGSFPRSPRDFSRNFWNLCDEKRERPSAGLGGGSLIYANVFMEPPEHVYDERWLASCRKPELAYYYCVAKEVLGARPVPLMGDPRRRIVRTGVPNAAPPSFGQVFGYAGLYVCDGSIVPSAVGANPTATIAALGERVAEGISGLRPDAE